MLLEKLFMILYIVYKAGGYRLKRISRHIIILCIYALVYMVLVENFSWLNFIIGLAVSFIAVTFSNRYLLFQNYEKLFPINFLGFIVYTIYLLAQVMISGVKAAVLTVTGNAKLEYYSYETSLPNDFTINLLANSITLTPGTVTVNRKNSELLIMQLCKKDQAFDVEGIKQFENKINKLVVRGEQ